MPIPQERKLRLSKEQLFKQSDSVQTFSGCDIPHFQLLTYPSLQLDQFLVDLLAGLLLSLRTGDLEDWPERNKPLQLVNVSAFFDLYWTRRTKTSFFLSLLSFFLPPSFPSSLLPSFLRQSLM